MGFFIAWWLVFLRPSYSESFSLEALNLHFLHSAKKKRKKETIRGHHIALSAQSFFLAIADVARTPYSSLPHLFSKDENCSSPCQSSNAFFRSLWKNWRQHWDKSFTPSAASSPVSPVSETFVAILLSTIFHVPISLISAFLSFLFFWTTGKHNFQSKVFGEARDNGGNPNDKSLGSSASQPGNQLR